MCGGGYMNGLTSLWACVEWFACLRNIIEHNFLIESTDAKLGHECTDAGVYTSPKFETAMQCPRCER